MSKTPLDQGEGLLPFQTEFAQQPKELVGIGHLRPRLREGLGTGLCVLFGGPSRPGRTPRLKPELQVRIDPAVDRLLPGHQIRQCARIDLVHRRAPTVIELQAGRLTAIGLCFIDHETGMPMGEEQPQIDVFTDRKSDRPFGRQVLIDAGFLVHRCLVAGQGHQRPTGLQVLEDGQPFPLQGHGPHRIGVHAGVSRDHRALAERQVLGSVARAHAFGARLGKAFTDGFRVTQGVCWCE